MKSLLVGSIILLASFVAHADDDKYICGGNGVRLSLVWDYFGQGLTETVQGKYQEKVFSFTADPNFPARRVDPDYKYKFFKDPKSETLVRMEEPDLSSVDDPGRFGTLFIDGKQISLDCLPARN